MWIYKEKLGASSSFLKYMLLPHHFFFKGESIATFRTKKWGLSPASFFLIFDSSHIRCVLLRKGQTTPALWNILKSLKKTPPSWEQSNTIIRQRIHKLSCIQFVTPDFEPR
jgi:hypothetical protein